MEQTEAQRMAAFRDAGVPLPPTKPIVVDTLSSTSAPMSIPPTPTPPNYKAIITGAITGATQPAQTFVTPSGATVDSTGNIIKTPAPAPEIKDKTVAERVKELLGVDATKPESLSGLRQKLISDEDFVKQQKEVADLSAQVKAIEAERQANILRAEVRGEGQVVEPIISRQQARIDKDYAIRVLPLTAQLNAAQGRLDMAKENINTILDLTFKDQQAERQWFNDLYDRAYAIATKEEQAKLDKKKEENQTKQREESTLNDWKMFYAKQAMDNDDIKTASSIATAKTIEDVERLAAGITVKTKAGETEKKSRINQVLDGFTSLADLTPSVKQEVIDDLYSKGFGSDEPPAWFRAYIQDKLSRTLTPEALKARWVEYRDSIMKNASKSSSSGLSFDDF